MRYPLSWLISWLLSLNVLTAETPPLLDPITLDSMRATVRLAMHEGQIPGGVLWFEHRGKVMHEAFGNRVVDPEEETNAEDTIYDAASLTKVTATAPAVMLLVQDGKVALDEEVVTYIPEFRGHGKEAITVKQLLTHTSGLRPGISRNPDWTGSEEGFQRIWADEPRHQPEEKFVYSDINYILLGELVRRVSGKALDEFCQERLFGPLKMTDTGFCPPLAKLNRIAPTTREGDEVIRGLVHDPTSRRMGGVTGHAGLFFTARDLAQYARMLLNGGELDGVHVMTPETVALMTRPHTPAHIDSLRGLGWDINSHYAHPRGLHFPPESFGHTGWTGTSIWIDPTSQSFLIFLSNRNHPSENGRARDVRVRLATLAAEAIVSRGYGKGAATKKVSNGVDVLVARRFRDLKGLKIGLITNHTGLTKGGASTIDQLHQAPDVTLKALFGPEHGLRGKAESKVADGKDVKTGLPIYSLYGETRQPTADQLKDLDALVFDIQDIGCRFYTYISTMKLAMRMAAKHDLKFFVLDRINPINGVTVDGPVRDGEASFTAIHPIPLRHGMTVGELALMIRAEEKLDLALRVIPVQGWRRPLYQDQTDVPWVNPSPNMRSLTEAILYPGVGLLEFMNLSVGRGTATPFELVGAPYIDATKFKKALDQLKLPGVRFEEAVFTPDKSIFKGEECRGVRILLTDRQKCRSVDLGLAMATHLAKTHTNEETKFENFKKLLVHPKTFQLVKEGASIAAIRKTWENALREFMKRRSLFLLY